MMLIYISQKCAPVDKCVVVVNDQVGQEACSVWTNSRRDGGAEGHEQRRNEQRRHESSRQDQKVGRAVENSVHNET